MKDSRTAILAIERAASQDEVLASVREYLSSLSADEFALLPAGLAALGTTHAEEVVHSALELVRHEMLVALDAPEAKLIKDAVQVFSTAATRLAMLAALNFLAPHPDTRPEALQPKA